MKDFRDFDVWRCSHQLTLRLYRITRSFPREEVYGLTSQIRRCSASIAANIAEGCGKRGNGEFQRYLQIASGSGSELDYHLLLARDLGYMNNEIYESVWAELTQARRMLTRLLLKVEQDRCLPDANCQMLSASR